MLCVSFFFFSSRRRHTRLVSDWSSDVCSSDLFQLVIIDKLEEGVFHSKLICVKDDERMEVDARTSDAIALAVRFRCPIFTYEHILASIGFVMEEGEAAGQDVMEPAEEKKTVSDKDLTQPDTEELKELLKRAIDDEAYERASKIRDELNKRKKPR